MNTDDLSPQEKKCLRTALNMLAYADNSRRRLAMKLRQKGFSADEIALALEYCVEKGYLDEQRQVESAVRVMASGKLYGRRRIAAELARLGFPRERIAEADYSEIDFAGNCLKLWLKRGGERSDKNRQYLAAHGYSSAEISAAEKKLLELEQENETNQDEDETDI